MTPPKFLVQTDDLNLHGYWTPEILLIDLSRHRGEAVRLFRLVGRWSVRYVPTTEAEVRGELEVARISKPESA